MTIVQVVATALLSGLFSGVVLFGLQERHSRAELALTKAESAYRAFAAYCDALVADATRIWDLVKGEKDTAQFQSETDAHTRLLDASRTEATLALAIYAPGELKFLDEAHAAAAIVVTRRAEIMLAKIRQEPWNQTHVDEINEAALAIVGHKRAGLAALAERARAIAERPHLLDWRRRISRAK